MKTRHHYFEEHDKENINMFYQLKKFDDFFILTLRKRERTLMIFVQFSSFCVFSINDDYTEIIRYLKKIFNLRKKLYLTKF